ncbi:Dnaj domain protein 19 [Candidatus Vecturithrix granuli]|uniref:Dnaj domain protein 19 n=1 Tax=Vecturithrix granuli TaxID=1499967 RepID=A0A0S6WAM0_VECG1|nr:Dnaj domain protein 19 [Candidatus Vecturithrix granuli]
MLFSKKPLAATPYQILGIAPNADMAEIKRAYFKLVREFPPEEQPEKFKEIRKAYEQLKSPEQKALVDMFLLQKPPVLPDLTKGRYDLTVHPEDMSRLALEFKLAELTVEKDFYTPET